VGGTVDFAGRRRSARGSRAASLHPAPGGDPRGPDPPAIRPTKRRSRPDEMIATTNAKCFAEQEVLRAAKNAPPITCHAHDAGRSPWIGTHPDGQNYCPDLLERQDAPCIVQTGLEFRGRGRMRRRHLLVSKKGKIGERYPSGRGKPYLKEVLDILAKITSLRAQTQDYRMAWRSRRPMHHEIQTRLHTNRASCPFKKSTIIFARRRGLPIPGPTGVVGMATIIARRSLRLLALPARQATWSVCSGRIIRPDAHRVASLGGCGRSTARSPRCWCKLNCSTPARSAAASKFTVRPRWTRKYPGNAWPKAGNPRHVKNPLHAMGRSLERRGILQITVTYSSENRISRGCD